MKPKILVPLIAVLAIIYPETTDAISPSRVYPRRRAFQTEVQDDVGDALILTPFIKDGKLEEGRKLSKVTNVSNVESFSGFFTVNPKYNSNMFFWFFPAVYNPSTAPVLVWLQGGPGGSSLFGLFVENGPFRVDKNMNLELRNTAWTLTHSVIYFENPVGTGFSFTDHDEGYAKTEDDVAHDLYSALTQFFTLFPEYKSKDFYVTGESYAGKYIPAIAHKIHVENQKSPEIRINLKGVAIGDGFSDPINMLNYGTFLRNVGLIDDIELEYFHKQEQACRDAINKQQWKEAFEVMDRLMDGDITGTPYFTNVTGFTFYFNYLMKDEPVDFEYYSQFVQQPYVRRGIHAGNSSFDEDKKVQTYLMEDMYKTVVPWIVDLLQAPENYKILLYSGQLDIIVAHINTEQMLAKMNWTGAEAYSKTPTKIWKVGKDIAGYVKNSGNLTYLLVRNSGHILPYDQPKWAFDMINRFTKGKPYA